MEKKKTAFIFLGNSTGSAFDIGVSKVLFKNFEPAFVIANSMGSANAACILKDKNYAKNIEEAEKLWKITDTRKIFKINKKIFYKLIFTNSLFVHAGLRKFLCEILDFKNRKIENSAIPFYINAYDYTNKKSIFFSKGSLLEAVIASCSAPIYFPPHCIGGIEYIDGGVNSRACVDKAIELGAKRIFVINVSSKNIKGKDLLSRFRKSISIMKTASIEHLFDSKIKDAVINISPDYDKLPKKFTDMKQTDILIRHGIEKTEQIIQKLT